MKPIEFLPPDDYPVHRPWFKIVFNPILRKLFGIQIGTVVDTETWTPLRYKITRIRGLKGIPYEKPSRTD